MSTKSILRFPELTRQAGIESSGGSMTSVDSVTEYFLLGSQASWFSALAPAILFLP